MLLWRAGSFPQPVEKLAKHAFPQIGETIWRTVPFSAKNCEVCLFHEAGICYLFDIVCSNRWASFYAQHEIIHATMGHWTMFCKRMKRGFNP